jgi:hypothetical protein
VKWRSGQSDALALCELQRRGKVGVLVDIRDAPDVVPLGVGIPLTASLRKRHVAFRDCLLDQLQRRPAASYLDRDQGFAQCNSHVLEVAGFGDGTFAEDEEAPARLPIRGASARRGAAAS